MVVAIGATAGAQAHAAGRHRVRQRRLDPEIEGRRGDDLDDLDDDAVVLLAPGDRAGGGLHDLQMPARPELVALLLMVIDQRRPEADLGRPGQDAAPSAHPQAQGTGDGVEAHLLVIARDHELVAVDARAAGATRFRRARPHPGGRIRAGPIGDEELVDAQLVALGRPGGRRRRANADGQVGRALRRRLDGAGQGRLLLRGERAGRQRPDRFGHAVDDALQIEDDIRGVGEEAAVAHMQHSVRPGDGDRAQDLFVLGQPGTRLLPGEDQSIDAEVRVVRVVAVVAAVGVVLAAVLGGGGQAVVAPLPDELPLDGLPAVDDPLILGQAAGAIAHRMAVLAQNARLGVRVLAEVVHLGHARVHRRDHVHALGVTILLVVHGPRVELLAACVHGPDVAAESRFVAQRPQDDAGVVALLGDQALDAVDEGGLPVRVVGDAGDIADVLEAVGLQIRLGDHHEADLVAHLVEARVVGVVGGPHRVDVVELHELQVAAHPLHVDGAAPAVVVVVAVDAAHLDVGAVEQEATVLDGRLGQPEAVGHRLGHGAVVVAHLHQQVVERGRLRVPCDRVGDVHGGGRIVGGDALRVRAVRAGEGPPDVAGSARGHLQGDVGAAVGGQASAGAELLQAHRRPGDEVDVAEDPGGPPHVLVLDIGAVAVLQDLDGQEVRLPVQVLGDIELGAETRALRHADEAAVDVDLGVGVHAVQAEDGLLAGAECGPGQFPLVDARRVRGGDQGLSDREGEALVGVLQPAVAIDLPQVRDPDLVPVGVGRGEVVLADSAGGVEEAEGPRAAEVGEARGQPPVAGGRGFGRGVAEEVGPGRQSVPVGQAGILPVVRVRH